MNKIRVADVEYVDDDSYEQRNLMKISDSATKQDITDFLYDQCGFTEVYVNRVYTIESNEEFKDWQIIEILS